MSLAWLPRTSGCRCGSWVGTGAWLSLGSVLDTGWQSGAPAGAKGSFAALDVKYPIIVYLARETHLRFTLSTEAHAGTWHLVLLNSDLSYSPQNCSSFFISQRLCLWNSYSKLNIFHTIYDS